MPIKLLLAGIVLAITLPHDASAQSPSQPPATEHAVGTWRGTSVCLVRPSACNDEVVVYRVTQLKAADSVAVDARKIVRGAEEEMAVLACRFVSSSGQLVCAMPRGVWTFRIRGDSLAGELRLLDGTRFRDIRATRAQ